MKYFKIDGHFKLPDDFTGDIVEAILVMIGYAKKIINLMILNMTTLNHHTKIGLLWLQHIQTQILF